MSITDGKIKKSSRAKRLLATTSVAALAALGAAIPALAATPPVFPNNIVIFPERDFITIEGYENHVGQTATITVTRGGVVSGQAEGVIAAGDPALEVNHPGGVCWGTGAGAPNVTPNIKPNDVVKISFPDGASDSARTQNTRVTGFSKVGANQLVVNGVVGTAVNKAFMEQRIINPDLDDTAIGRRDVRAPARPGPYTSTLAFPTATTFRATYTFNDTAGTAVNEGTQMRDIAAAGQMRSMAWMAEDADANRQGLTISEFGEVGGPGMGGCPAGPESTPPNAPTGVSATAGDAAITANWNAATVIPDGSPITGYRVTATTPGGVETSVNASVNARTATVTGLQNGTAYTVDVRATSAAGLGRVGSASGTVTPQSAVAPKPGAPTIGAASDGLVDDAAISATATWTDSVQPAGITIDGYRVTAYNVNADGTLGSRIRSVFVDAPASQREVTFASAPAGKVTFKVQAIDADGTLSSQSARSNDVTAQ